MVVYLFSSEKLKQFIDNADNDGRTLDCKGEEPVYKSCKKPKKSLSAEIYEDNLTIKNCVLSTEDKDGDGEIIRQDGWIFDRFINNPVMVAQHRRRDKAIGKWENVRVENCQLIGDAHFADNDIGKDYFNLYKNGFMSGFSVGYRAIKKATIDENSSPYWGPFEYLQQELLEISCVTLPCNPNAVTGIKSLIGDKQYEVIKKEFGSKSSVAEIDYKKLAEEIYNVNKDSIEKSLAPYVLKGLVYSLDAVEKGNEDSKDEIAKDNKEDETKDTDNKDKKKSFEEFIKTPEVEEYAKSLDDSLTEEQVISQLAEVYLEYEKEFDK